MNTVRLSTLKPGEKFDTKIGRFLVLYQDAEKGEAGVITDCLYREDEKFSYTTCNYMESGLKAIFDDDITEDFAEEFGEDLVEHEVNLFSVDMQEYGTFKCKTRPLTFDEARMYNRILVNKDLPDWWWTCTPWSAAERGWGYSVAVVSPSGIISSLSCGISNGVLPFCVLKSNIFVSTEE